MEMLNNIWNALSTENMDLINTYMANPCIIIEIFLTLLRQHNLVEMR